MLILKSLKLSIKVTPINEIQIDSCIDLSLLFLNNFWILNLNFSLLILPIYFSANKIQFLLTHEYSGGEYE